MNIQLSEVFLLAWGMLATVAAVYFQGMFRKATKGGIVLCVILEAIAHGKAELKLHPDGRMTVDMGDHEVTLKEVS